MASIGVSFTPDSGSPVYSFVFRNFGGNEMPRTYTGTASFSQSSTGTTILGGPAFVQKRIWAISSLIETTEAEQFDVMFQAWDADRANGLPVACGVTDNTFGSTVNANAIFSTPPSYTRAGTQYTIVSFGLTEV